MEKEYSSITYLTIWDPKNAEEQSLLGNNFYVQANPVRKIQPFELSPFSGKITDLDEKEYIIKFISPEYIDDFCEGRDVHTSSMPKIREIEYNDSAQGDCYEGVAILSDLDGRENYGLEITINENTSFEKKSRSIAVPGTVSNKQGNGINEQSYDLLDAQGIICAFSVTKELVDKQGKLRSEVVEQMIPISGNPHRPFIVTSRENFEESIYQGILNNKKCKHKSVIFKHIEYTPNNVYKLDRKSFSQTIESSQAYKFFFRKRLSYKDQNEIRVFIESGHHSNWNNKTIKVSWIESIRRYEFDELKEIQFEF